MKKYRTMYEKLHTGSSCLQIYMRLRNSNNLQVVRPKCKFIQHSRQNMPSEGESVYFNNDILMLQNLEWKGFFQV